MRKYNNITIKNSLKVLSKMPKRMSEKVIKFLPLTPKLRKLSATIQKWAT